MVHNQFKNFAQRTEFQEFIKIVSEIGVGLSMSSFSWEKKYFDTEHKTAFI